LRDRPGVCVETLERSLADNRRTRTAGGTYNHKLTADDHNHTMAAIGQMVVVISGSFSERSGSMQKVFWPWQARQQGAGLAHNDVPIG
jgi:hypothetical protein